MTMMIHWYLIWMKIGERKKGGSRNTQPSMTISLLLTFFMLLITPLSLSLTHKHTQIFFLSSLPIHLGSTLSLSVSLSQHTDHTNLTFI